MPTGTEQVRQLLLGHHIADLDRGGGVLRQPDQPRPQPPPLRIPGPGVVVHQTITRRPRRVAARGVTQQVLVASPAGQPMQRHHQRTADRPTRRASVTPYECASSTGRRGVAPTGARGVIVARVVEQAEKATAHGRHPVVGRSRAPESRPVTTDSCVPPAWRLRSPRQYEVSSSPRCSWPQRWPRHGRLLRAGSAWRPRQWSAPNGPATQPAWHRSPLPSWLRSVADRAT